MAGIIVQDVLEEILNMMGEVLGDPPKKLHEPCFSHEDVEAVSQVVKSGFVSSVGTAIDDFESGLRDLTGAKHVIAVVNGTAALHLGLHCAGVRYGDEVIMPSLTFAATANSAMMTGAVPHFVDSCTNDIGIECSALRTYLREITVIKGKVCFNRVTDRPIRAIIPVHVFGHIGNIEDLIDIASEFRLKVIEDAAEALGSTKGGKHAGLFGCCGSLSFNGNKIITTGGGGAVLTNDDYLAARISHVSKTAKKLHRFKYFHDELGFNYRMPALNAALGTSQLLRMSHFLTAKERLTERYRSMGEKYEGFNFFESPVGSHSNNWLNAIQLKKSSLADRDYLLERLNNIGYQCRPAWDLLSSLPHLKHCPKMPLDNAKKILGSIINVPSGSALADGF